MAIEQFHGESDVPREVSQFLDNEVRMASSTEDPDSQIELYNQIVKVVNYLREHSEERSKRGGGKA